MIPRAAEAELVAVDGAVFSRPVEAGRCSPDRSSQGPGAAASDARACETRASTGDGTNGPKRSAENRSLDPWRYSPGCSCAFSEKHFFSQASHVSGLGGIDPLRTQTSLTICIAAQISSVRRSFVWRRKQTLGILALRRETRRWL